MEAQGMEILRAQGHSEEPGVDGERVEVPMSLAVSVTSELGRHGRCTGDSDLIESHAHRAKI